MRYEVCGPEHSAMYVRCQLVTLDILLYMVARVSGGICSDVKFHDIQKIVISVDKCHDIYYTP